MANERAKQLIDRYLGKTSSDDDENASPVHKGLDKRAAHFGYEHSHNKNHMSGHAESVYHHPMGHTLHTDSYGTCTHKHAIGFGASGVNIGQLHEYLSMVHGSR